MKKLAVIIVTYKFPKAKVERLIHEIVKQGVAKKDIFVRDNTNDNIGYAGAINGVVKKQLRKYSYFLILNPDIQLHPNAIKELLKAAEENKGDIVGGVIYDEKGKVWGSAGVIDRKRYSAGMVQEASDFTMDRKYKRKVKESQSYIVDFVPGTVILIKREVFEKVGYFETDYFLYYDEVDFEERAKKFGFRLVINPKAKITHFASETVGKNSAAMNYYIARSHLLFIERHAPTAIKLRELIRIPRTLYQARNNKWELLGIRDYFLRKKGRNPKILVEADK